MNEVDVDVVAECTGFFTTKELQTSTSMVEQKSNYFCISDAPMFVMG
jgi:glyceraldehyde 3-phosphate dehydrogenase